MTNVSRTTCRECGASILSTTADKNGGRCAPCARGTRGQSERTNQAFAEQRARRRASLDRLARAPRLSSVDRICEVLDGITSVEDESQLEALQIAIESVSGVQEPARAARAMLGVLERFPRSDGYGTFWSILHSLESIPGYERALIDSIRRRACEFNLLMVNRIINTGTTDVCGTSLLGLLQEVVDSREHDADAREAAARYLARQEGA